MEERLDEEDEQLDGTSSLAIDVLSIARSGIVLVAIALGLVCGSALAVNVHLLAGIATMVALSSVLVVAGLALVQLAELAVWRRLAARVCAAPPV